MSALVQRVREHRAASLAIAATGATAVFRFAAPDLVWLGLACALGALAVMMTTRLAGERLLTWLVSVSFALRCVLAVVLFAASSTSFPLLSSLHVEYGLWAFGIDGVSSHEFAVRALDAWRAGHELPVYVPEMLTFSVPLAAVYWVLGASPLHFIIVNCWLGAITGLLAYRLAGYVGAGRHQALAAAAVLTFWPSSIIWSAQLLKDSAGLALILSVFVLAAGLWHRPGSAPWRWPMLAVALFALAMLRSHVAAAMAGSLVGAFGIALLVLALRRRWRDAVTAVAITGITVTAMVAAHSIDPVVLTSPGNPERAYLRLGQAYEDHGEFIPAQSAYRVAIGFNPRSVEGYRGVIRSLFGDEQFNTARVFFARYQELEADNAQRLALSALVRTAPPPPPPVVAARPMPPPAPPATWLEAQTRRMEERWTAVTSTVPLLSLLSMTTIVTFRESQIAFAGGEIVDRTTFDGWAGFLLFVPKAYALAFLAPYPWDLMAAGASTGAFRPIAALETVLIMFCVPAILLAGWRTMTTFRPEAWMTMLFVAATALSYALFMPNGGTLFRVRLQFLFPALILAATVLPPIFFHAARHSAEPLRA